MIHATNCINCGSVLHGNKCEYCGTEYNEKGGFTASFGENDYKGTLTIGNETFNVYIGNIETTNILLGGYKFGDSPGRMFDKVATKRKFSLIEY